MADPALDIEQPETLIAYLRRAGHIGLTESLEMQVLAGGVSNRTVLVRRSDGQDWVIKQALARLRVATEWTSNPRRVHREAAGLRWLSSVVPEAVPQPVFEDFENHLFAMTAVPQPHMNFKSELLAGRIEPASIDQFASLLARVHRHGCEQAGVVAAEFDDRSFFESLRLEPYYAYSAVQCPRAATFLADLMHDCRERRYTVVHGDYSPKNVLIHNDRLVLLDHEVIHFGDGAFDVGFALTHLLSKAHHLPASRRSFATAARQFWSIYRAGMSGMAFADLEPMVVRHTLGCLLARVVGRSPLEYLGPCERERQADVVVELMSPLPKSLPNLIDAFIERT